MDKQLEHWNTIYNKVPNTYVPDVVSAVNNLIQSALDEKEQEYHKWLIVQRELLKQEINKTNNYIVIARKTIQVQLLDDLISTHRKDTP